MHSTALKMLRETLAAAVMSVTVGAGVAMRQQTMQRCNDDIHIKRCLNRPVKPLGPSGATSGKDRQSQSRDSITAVDHTCSPHNRSQHSRCTFAFCLNTATNMMMSQKLRAGPVAKTASRRTVVVRAAGTATKEKVRIGINGGCWLPRVGLADHSTVCSRLMPPQPGCQPCVLCASGCFKALFAHSSRP